MKPCILSAVIVASSASAILAQSETGLGPDPFYSREGKGANFGVVGTYTRQHGVGTAQSDPFDLAIASLPTGAAAVKTYVMWSYTACASPPSTDTIEIDSNQVQGTLVGSGTPELCWFSEGCATPNAFAYMAEITISHGTTVSIEGATDKTINGGTAYGEGLTILTVFEYSVTSEEPMRVVDLYRGYISTESGTTVTEAEATLNFSNAYGGGGARFFVNALDGQQDDSPNADYRDSFYINNTNVGGSMNGTGSSTDAWQGLLGDNAHSNMYDHAIDGIGALLTVNDTSVDIKTVRPSTGDCVGHSFAAISFEID